MMVTPNGTFARITVSYKWMGMAVFNTADVVYCKLRDIDLHGGRMGLIGWIRTQLTGEDRRLLAWRQAWRKVSTDPTPDHLRALRHQLDAVGLPEDDLEIEREMLDALEAVLALSATVAQSGLPVLQTGHRIVGADVCHYTAPVSMPDEPSQPSGRLILTSARAIFVGGRGLTLPWHAIAQVLHADRDLLMARRGQPSLYRFQCNTFADAMCAAFLARRLGGGRGAERTEGGRDGGDGDNGFSADLLRRPV
jgi:hypothetical protein